MICFVCLAVKPVGEPYAGNPHVRFDERGWETERCRMAQATALILDSTFPVFIRIDASQLPALEMSARPSLPPQRALFNIPLSHTRMRSPD